MFTLYTLAQQQLSKQYHYDFGLRGIVTLTRYAGKKKRLYPGLPDDEVYFSNKFQIDEYMFDGMINR